MIKYVSLVFLMVLSGCATEGKYREKLQTWVGQDSSDLVAKWGTPDGSIDMPDGRKAYIYKEHAGSRTNVVQGSTGTDYVFTTNYSCKTTFFTDPSTKKVVTWEYDGNNCVSE